MVHKYSSYFNSSISSGYLTLAWSWPTIFMVTESMFFSCMHLRYTFVKRGIEIK